MGESKADRERREFRREARKLFGKSANVSGVTHAVQQPMYKEAEEAKRLATVHDPTKPSGCRICGLTVEPSAGWSEVGGWKLGVCCVELLPGGLAAVMTELLGMTVTETEAIDVCAKVPCRNPAYFLHRWPTDAGQPSAWAHLAPSFAGRATEVLAELRAEAMPRRNTFGTGCGWCGVARSTSWTETPWRIGRGQSAPRVAACSECEPWIARSGACSEVYDDWHCHLLACCVEMRRAQWAVDYGLRAFWEAPDVDPAGTAERWQYLGPLRDELRMRVARDYPRNVVLTDRERRVVALQRAAADTGQPAQRTPLAKL